MIARFRAAAAASTLRTRLVMGLSAALLVIAAGQISAIVSMRHFSEMNAKLTRDHLVTLNYVRLAREAFTEVRGTTAALAASMDGIGISDLDVCVDNLTAKLAIIERHGADSETRDQIEAIRAALQQIVQVARENGPDGQARIGEIEEQILTALDVVAEVTVGKGYLAAEQMGDGIWKIERAMISVFALCFVLAAVVVSRATRSVIRSVGAAVATADRIRNGDLTTPVPSRDGLDIRPLFVALQSMQDAMKERQRQSEELVEARTREAQALQRLALTDPLTGASNRRHLMERAIGEMARAQREHRPLSVVLFDIDHFKMINDNWGHAVGDGVLQKVVEITKGALRPSDVLSRVGGEEFVLLLPSASAEAATVVAERLRVALAADPMDAAGQLVTVTASFGVAEVQDNEDNIEQPLARADRALYDAKHGGRNRVEVAPSLASERMGAALGGV